MKNAWDFFIWGWCKVKGQMIKRYVEILNLISIILGFIFLYKLMGNPYVLFQKEIISLIVIFQMIILFLNLKRYNHYRKKEGYVSFEGFLFGVGILLFFVIFEFLELVK